MSTFLQICQWVGRKSGTVSGNQPLAVTSQTGRLLKVVSEVDEAWDELQSKQKYWDWMRREFSETISNPTRIYTPAALNLTDFARWDESMIFTIYKTTDGVGTEGALTFEDWRTFSQTRDVGTIQTGKPSHFTIRPRDNAVIFNTIPDVDHVVGGNYMKGNQELVADADLPELPTEYHKAVNWLALQNLSEHDEAFDMASKAEKKFEEIYNELTGDQLEDVTLGGDPIA